MPSFLFGLGKGLKEPCWSFREAYFFGAALNQPNADGWNCIPQIVEPTTSFDLSTIPKGREVVVAFLGESNASAGEYHIRFRWFRSRDAKLLYDYTFDYTAPVGGWLYAYSYLGYVDWELAENGNYLLEITVTGVKSYKKVIPFTISGISEVIPVPVPSVGFMAGIIDKLNGISGFFYSIQQEVAGWVFPFYFISYPFYTISLAFNQLAWNFRDFASWVYDITNKATSLLSWSTIWSYIISRIPNLEAIRDWFYFWWTWVDQRVTDFWAIQSLEVKGWISFSAVPLRIGLQSLSGLFGNLSQQWDNFRITTLPNLADWNGVNSLISSRLADFTPFLEGWQDWRDKVAEFFTDPEDWLYKAADRIIERYW